MFLEDLRKKVIYQNTLDVWIGACQEKNLKWNDLENYKKFIDYLSGQNLNMKKFPLCVTEADLTPEDKEKTKFAEILSESTDPKSSTYTIKLNDSTIDVIRKFELKN